MEKSKAASEFNAYVKSIVTFIIFYHIRAWTN